MSFYDCSPGYIMWTRSPVKGWVAHCALRTAFEVNAVVLLLPSSMQWFSACVDASTWDLKESNFPQQGDFLTQYCFMLKFSDYWKEKYCLSLLIVNTLTNSRRGFKEIILSKCQGQKSTLLTSNSALLHTHCYTSLLSSVNM